MNLPSGGASSVPQSAQSGREKVSRRTGGTDEVEQSKVHGPNSSAPLQVSTSHEPAKPAPATLTH